MSDILALKRALNDRVIEVAALLLPNGKRVGHEWCVGSTRGEPGESLKVCLHGNKVGIWSDFAAGGEGGDLIDLWCEVRGIDLAAAIDQVRGHLGIERPQFERPAEKTYRRPTKPRSVAPAGPVESYLVGERKLSKPTIARYGVTARDREMVFSSLIGDELVFVKYLSIDRKPDGKKITSVERDCEPVLWGWPVVDPSAREVIITEGEIDAMSWYEYGRAALSVPFGGGKGAKQRWIESEYDRLARFEKIYLSMDMDEEGESAVQEIVSRLGRERCYRVKLPRKDANECLKASVPRDQMFKALDAASSMDPPELRRAGEFTDLVVESFYPTGEREAGYRLPFKAVGDDVIFRKGEMTIWTGETGHGKTQLLCHASIDFIAQGGRVCTASLEMAAKRLLPRMTRQAANTDRPTKSYIRAIMEWMNEGLWLFNHTGESGLTKVLEIFEYARARYGCDVFIIDSLMRLGYAPDDYAGQAKAATAVATWADKKDVHVHLVAHARKPDMKATGGPADINDVKGTSEIASNASNVISVWRNKKLEDEVAAFVEEIDRGETDNEDKLQELLKKRPVIVRVAKQRNGDWEGKVGLWFNRSTYQYRSAEDSRHGRQYVEFSDATSTAAAAE